MIYVGPNVIPDYFVPNCVVFGDFLGTLGPSVAKWVMMGHESLETRYLSVSANVSMSQLTVDMGEAASSLQVTTATGSFIVANDAEARNFGGQIDDVSLRQMGANGALVKQWEQ